MSTITFEIADEEAHGGTAVYSSEGLKTFVAENAITQDEYNLRFGHLPKEKTVEMTEKTQTA